MCSTLKYSQGSWLCAASSSHCLTPCTLHTTAPACRKSRLTALATCIVQSDKEHLASAHTFLRLGQQAPIVGQPAITMYAAQLGRLHWERESEGGPLPNLR